MKQMQKKLRTRQAPVFHNDVGPAARIQNFASAAISLALGLSHSAITQKIENLDILDNQFKFLKRIGLHRFRSGGGHDKF